MKTWKGREKQSVYSATKIAFGKIDAQKLKYKLCMPESETLSDNVSKNLGTSSESR